MKMADAKQKRNEQLKRWIGSETDLEPPVVKRKKTKVKFDDGAVFLAACSSGDTEEVLRLLERGADINYANVDGLTALHQVGAGPSEGSWPHWGGGRRARPAEFPPSSPGGRGGGGRGRRRRRSLRWGVSGRGAAGSARLRPGLGKGGGAADPPWVSPQGRGSGPCPAGARGAGDRCCRCGRVGTGERGRIAPGAPPPPALPGIPVVVPCFPGLPGSAGVEPIKARSCVRRDGSSISPRFLGETSVLFII